MSAHLDFAAIFAKLEAEGAAQHHAVLGGIDVRCVRVEAGGAGRWDSHPETPETVVVWAGAFDVAFRDSAISLGPGQCCVVPAGAEHKGTSPTGAQVVLFKNVGP